MANVIQITAYGFIAIFGIAISAAFCDADNSKGAFLKLLLFSIATIVAQVVCRYCFGFDFTREIYPLFVHLPLVLFLIAAFDIKPVAAFTSVITAYLCCQIPRFFASFVYFLTHNTMHQNIFYIILVPVTYYFLKRYAAAPTSRLILQSTRSAVAVGLVPLFYYLFDYATTVYTEILYSGEPFVVQFMPSVVAVGYFFFIIIYTTSLTEREQALHERDLLSLELRQSESEFDAIQKMQNQARQYRHDLHHHCSLLLGLAEDGDIEKIKDYVNTAARDLASYTPKHFCSNKIVDVMLSYFSEEAQKTNVEMRIQVNIPDVLPFEDTEICSVLSNGIENALNAVSRLTDDYDKYVSVSLMIKQHNLLIAIENPYIGEIKMVNGIPASSKEGHGFGTKGIVYIVNKHNGQVSFSADGYTFRLRVMLPIT